MARASRQAHGTRVVRLARLASLALVALTLTLTACAAPTTPELKTSEPTSSTLTTGSPPLVAVIGDFGSGDANERAVADLVAAYRPQAIVTTGDNRYTDAPYASVVGDYYGQWVDRESFFPAIGNHDYEKGIDAFVDYFAYLHGQRDFVETVGNIAFFILDGEQSMASLDSAHNQESWLAAAIGASPARFRVVVVHYPPFSSSTRHGSTPNLQWDFAALGVSLVLSGHDHTYERIAMNDVTYVVNGAGGKDLYDCGEPVEGSVVCDDKDFGALFLSASGNVMTGQFVNVSGEVVDEFSLDETR